MNFPCFILPSIDSIHLKSQEMDLFRQSCVLHNLILGYYYFTEISTFAEQKKNQYLIAIDLFVYCSPGIFFSFLPIYSFSSPFISTSSE